MKNAELERFAQVHTSASIRNWHDRQDVLQDIRVVFMLLEKKYGDLSEEAFIKVAKTACRNRVRDYIRSKMQKLELPKPPSSRIDLKQIDAREVLAGIKKSVSPEKASILHFMELGLETQDVQTLFSISRMQLYRLLRSIRKTNQGVKDAVHHTECQEGTRRGVEEFHRESAEEGLLCDMGGVELSYNASDTCHTA